MLGKSPRAARVRLARNSRSGGLGRRLACLPAVAAALLIAAPAVQSANLFRGDIGPRLQTIGPRSNPIDTVGPRFDPTFHAVPGGGYGNVPGGGTGASGGGASGGAAGT